VVPRPAAGGWSQMHFQRHADGHRLEHVRECIDVLADVVRERNVEHVLLAGDDVVGPLLANELPPALVPLTIGVVPSEMHSSDDAIQQAAQEAVWRREHALDVGRVQALLDAYHSGGLGVVGSTPTMAALARGQVHELLLSTAIDSENGPPRELAPAGSDPMNAADTDSRRAAANALVIAALRTAARVRFIDDPGLLGAVGGVSGMLRYQL
jgi:peptide subunit release factor 1 (eRF1)